MKKIAFMVLSLIITVAAAYYQRKTGPTYPVEGKAPLNDSVIKYSLSRSHGGEEDYEVTIQAENRDVGGYVLFKRYKTEDPWTQVPMERKGDSLVATLPHQPPAGKLMYRVILTYQGKEVPLTADKPVIIRFKGDVPVSVTILHVIVMFLAMLVSNRAGIEAFNPEGKLMKYAFWVIGLLFAGAFILGPLMQKFAFGVWWSGFPLGFDLTDNKTLIAFIGWVLALIMGRNKKSGRWWYLGAALLLFAVYMIPHSLLGSELDYPQM